MHLIKQIEEARKALEITSNYCEGLKERANQHEAEKDYVRMLDVDCQIAVCEAWLDKSNKVLDDFILTNFPIVDYANK